MAGTPCPGVVPPRGQEFYFLTLREVFTKVKTKMVNTGNSAKVLWILVTTKVTESVISQGHPLLSKARHVFSLMLI